MQVTSQFKGSRTTQDFVHETTIAWDGSDRKIVIEEDFDENELRVLVMRPGFTSECIYSDQLEKRERS